MEEKEIPNIEDFLKENKSNETTGNKSASVTGYAKEDLLSFASWVYGPEIDCLPIDDQYACRTHEGALEYWLENVRRTAA